MFQSKNSIEMFGKNYNLSYNIMVTKTRSKNTNYLLSLRRRAKGEATTAKVDKIIELYSQSKISQVQTAENIINKLTASKTEKEQKSAFKKYDKIVNKYKENEPFNKRLVEKKQIKKTAAKTIIKAFKKKLEPKDRIQKLK